jgi:large conductance mechanosensitive channel
MVLRPARGRSTMHRRHPDRPRRDSALAAGVARRPSCASSTPMPERCQFRGDVMIKGFKNFLMRGDVVVIAIGLMVALAFSTLIKAFTDAIVNPILNRLQGGGGIGLGIQLGDHGNPKTFVDIGSLISAVIYFVVFMAVLYFFIVVPYKGIMARQGATVFGAPERVKTCPACKSGDLPVAASKCRYCGTEQPATAAT